jgi:hypothetical protein
MQAAHVAGQVLDATSYTRIHEYMLIMLFDTATSGHSGGRSAHIQYKIMALHQSVHFMCMHCSKSSDYSTAAAAVVLVVVVVPLLPYVLVLMILSENSTSSLRGVAVRMYSNVCCAAAAAAAGGGGVSNTYVLVLSTIEISPLWQKTWLHEGSSLYITRLTVMACCAPCVQMCLITLHLITGWFM